MLVVVPDSGFFVRGLPTVGAEKATVTTAVTVATRCPGADFWPKAALREVKRADWQGFCNGIAAGIPLFDMLVALR